MKDKSTKNIRLRWLTILPRFIMVVSFFVLIIFGILLTNIFALNKPPIPLQDAILSILIGLVLTALVVSLYFLLNSVIQPLKALREDIDSVKFDTNPLINSDEATGTSITNIENSLRFDDIYSRMERQAEVSQDETSQLAFSIARLLHKLRHAYEDQEIKIHDRMEAINKRAMQFHNTSEITREINASKGSDDLEGLLSRVAELITTKFGYYFTGIFLIDPKQRSVVLHAGSGEAGKTMKKRFYSVRIGESSLVGYAAMTGFSRIVNDVMSDFLHQKEPSLPLTQSEAVFPLLVKGSVLGVLDIQSVEKNTFDSDQLAVLQVLSDLLAFAIENRVQETALAQASAEVKTLYQRYIEQSWSVKKSGNANTGFEYNRLEIHPIDKSIEPGLIAQLQKGVAVILPDENGIDKVGLSVQGRETLLAPILMYNKLVGVVGLEGSADSSGEGGKQSWTPEDIQMVQSLTNQIALAMDNARLLEESQTQAAQLRLLQEVTSAASAHTDLGELLDHVTQTLRADLDIQYCGAVLFDQSQQFGHVAAGSSIDPNSAHNRFCDYQWPLRDTPAIEQLIRNGKSILINDPVHNMTTAPLHFMFQQVNTSQLVLIPLVLRSQVIGMLDVHFSGYQRDINDDNLRLFDQISLQIASAIEVAQSFQEATLKAERERKISEVVRHIRETLDIQTILRSAAEDIQKTFDLPEVTVRLIATEQNKEKNKFEG